MLVIARACFCCAFATTLLSGMRSPAQEKAPKNTARLTPIPLFTGELKRLEPHLALATSGCVKGEFDGQKTIVTQLHVWQNRKKQAIPTPVGRSLPVTKDCEVSISVREEAAAGGKMNYKIIVASPLGSYTTLVERPKLGPVILTTQSRKATVQDGVPVAVWAFGAFKGGNLLPIDQPLEPELERADWALVLSIRLDKVK